MNADLGCVGCFCFPCDCSVSLVELSFVALSRFSGGGGSGWDIGSGRGGVRR
jgi:hypothetical protein